MAESGCLVKMIMQEHNYNCHGHNKPNCLKISLKLSNLWLFKCYMHVDFDVMSGRAACGKMAAMRGRWSPLANSVRFCADAQLKLMGE